MNREECLDWLYRLKSEIFVYMPEKWLVSMGDALEMAIEALEHPEKNVVKVVPCGDAISRRAAIDAMATWEWQELYLPIHFKQLLEDLPSVSTEKTDAYKQGWHDAIITALKETHSVYTEEGHFRVVQEETLIGVGMAYEPQEREVSDAGSN